MIEDLIEKAKQYKIALGLGLLGAIVAGFILLQGRDQGGTDVQQLTEQTSSSSSYKDEKSNKSNEISQADTEDQLVTVDVKGAVKKPGVYQLQSNSRVHDALEKAGGMTEEADLKSINQAQKLSDEAVVYLSLIHIQMCIRDSITTANEEEGNADAIILNNAIEKYIVADNSKFDSYSFYTFYRLDDVNAIVTDDNISQRMKDKYQSYTKVL